MRWSILAHAHRVVGENEDHLRTRERCESQCRPHVVGKDEERSDRRKDATV